MLSIDCRTESRCYQYSTVTPANSSRWANLKFKFYLKEERTVSARDVPSGVNYALIHYCKFPACGIKIPRTKVPGI
jgi:hypothetical protein